MKIGVISDTHGKVAPEVFTIFEGVDQIWHAGDIGSVDVISELETIAPLVAVHGNMDRFPLVSEFPIKEIIEVNNNRILLTHQYMDKNFRRLTDKTSEFDQHFQAIIYGHTHMPLIRHVNDVLYFNPGSATSSRYGGKRTIGLLTIRKEGSFSPEIIFLD